MKYLRVLYPLGYFCQQDVVSEVVEVAPKIYVNNSGESLYQPVHNSMQCLVGRTPGTVSKRTLEIVCFKDRLHDKLYRSLYNAILDGGNSEPSSFFEADFHESSFAYRPRRTAHQALDRVVHGLVHGLTRVID